MKTITKSQRRRLREIADECYLNSLEEALAELYEDFQKWGGDRISAFELDERIHNYHQKTARETITGHPLKKVKDIQDTHQK